MVSIIWDTILNLASMPGEYVLARRTPVIIWIIRQRDNNDPIFQNTEILRGAGSVTRVESNTFRIGFFLKY